MANTPSEKILSRLKGLRTRMREGEQPLFSIPAIWENATEHQSSACDLVLTNQRIFGYIYTTFPRERLFLDALELDAIKTITIRQKNFEVLFRELFVSDGKKRVYIRATGKRVEEAYAALRETMGKYAPATWAILDANEGDNEQAIGSGVAPEVRMNQQGEPENEVGNQVGERSKVPGTPTYSRQKVRQSLERSPMGITLLLAGGLILEVIGVLAWAATGSLQTGVPLFLAGLIAVIVATFARRALR